MQKSTKQKHSLWLRLLSWKVLIPFFLLLGVLATPFVVRQYHLSQVPYIGDPFDLEKHGTVVITEEENGYVEYKLGHAKLKSKSQPRLIRTQDGETTNPFDFLFIEQDWSHATPAVKKWLHINQEALAIWKKGTSKPKFFPVQPKDFKVDEEISERIDDSSLFHILALLQARKLAFEGKLEQAQEWHRAIFLFGCQLHQYTGLYEQYAAYFYCYNYPEQQIWWANHADVTIAQLKRLLQNLKDDEKLVVPLSTILRHEYYWYKNSDVLNSIEESSRIMDGIEQDYSFQYLKWKLEFFMKGEPDRCWNLHQLAFDNLLAGVDKPISQQIPATAKFNFFINPSLKTHFPSGFSANDLEKLIEQSQYASNYLNPTGHLAFKRKESITKRRILQVLIAAKIYKKKFGFFPQSKVELLSESDLNTMPLDATKMNDTEITYRHTQGFTAVYIIRTGKLDHQGVEATWEDPSKDMGYILENKKVEVN